MMLATRAAAGSAEPRAAPGGVRTAAPPAAPIEKPTAMNAAFAPALAALEALPPPHGKQRR